MVTRLAAAAAVVALLQGCATTSHELYEGISAPRDLADIDLVIERVPDPDLRCRDLFRASGGRALPWGFAFYAGCANLPFDREIPEGRRPWCRVVIWDGEPANSRILRHELEHCQGYRDA